MYKLPIRENVIKEAERCLNCKMPRCKAACPVSTEIPEVIQMLLKGQEYEAGEVLFKNNPLSVICALVCPHENQCEGSCVLGIKGEPVRIGQIEHYLSTEYMENKVSPSIIREWYLVA
jgi:glutamate synthase (NADPH/NADH) small chain